jgi:exosome complex component CSL4
MIKKIYTQEVFPGEKLAIIEEFNEGEGTYQFQGEIISSEIGKTNLDMQRRAIYVKKMTPKPLYPEEGMEVIAEVGSVARKDARIDIFTIDGKENFPTISGVIHISDISKDYIRNIDIAVKSGDIIKGKIVNTKNRLNQTSIAGAEYGVIYAYCTRCGGLLEKNRGKLTCPDCGRVESRKTAKSYGKEYFV